MGQAGNNDGWNIMEGAHCYHSSSCKQEGLILPAITYSNDTASAVTDWGIINVGNILSFGQDAQNALYMLSGTGKVYQIVRK